jgi:hypothetical protein
MPPQEKALPIEKKVATPSDADLKGAANVFKELVSLREEMHSALQNHKEKAITQPL